MDDSKEHYRDIAFLILPTVQLLDLAGPVQAFDAANFLGADYKIIYCGMGDEITSGQDLILSNIEPFNDVTLDKDDLLFIPGISGKHIESGEFRKYSSNLYDWLREQHKSEVKLCSVCNGAFILAEAGLLDGLSCTTHWERFDQLESEYPELRVLKDQLFVKNESIYTSAGIASGIDLALSIIEEEHGSFFASKVAKELVVYMRRESSQSQVSTYLDYRSHINPGIHDVQDMIVNNQGIKLSLDELSDTARMSTRNLTRIFKRSTGLTISEYTNKIRLELASTLMNNPKLSIENIAARCGFEDARQFRRLWNSAHGKSPSQSRQNPKSLSRKSNHQYILGDNYDVI